MKMRTSFAVGAILSTALAPITTLAAIPLEVGIGSTSSVNDFGEYLNGVYTFITSSIGIIAAVMIMFNGMRWVTAGGNSENISVARGGITNAIIGLIIALTSYVLLYAINPALVSTATPTVASINFTASGTESGTGACSPVTSGPCTVENLMAAGFSETAATQASSICGAESGGNPNIASGVDLCEPGGEAVSFGLFQFNITANKMTDPSTHALLDCPSAFTGGPYTGSDHTCTISNSTLYTQCVNAAKDPATNIQAAINLSSGGTHWRAWGANTKCGFPR